MLYTFTSYSSIYELYVVVLRACITFAVFLSLFVSADRLFLVSKYILIHCKTKYTGKSPEEHYTFHELPELTDKAADYPKVAVQLPMFNERAVCQVR